MKLKAAENCVILSYIAFRMGEPWKRSSSLLTSFEIIDLSAASLSRHRCCVIVCCYLFFIILFKGWNVSSELKPILYALGESCPDLERFCVGGVWNLLLVVYSTIYVFSAITLRVNVGGNSLQVALKSRNFDLQEDFPANGIETIFFSFLSVWTLKHYMWMYS